MKKGDGGFLVAGKILSALVAFLCSFATAHAALAGEAGLYSTLYPYYAEVCALSQILKKPGFGADIRGGPGGHSILYLNGVRRKKDAHYPTLEMSDPAASAAQQGVGLSVNEHFKNVNWVATDGPDFFFGGGLSPSARLTRDAYRKTQARAEAMGIYDGVEFQDEVFDDMPPGMSRRDYMYEVSVATDYAIDFGRDRYCARVPLDRAKMSAVVDYLNGLNDIYKSGKTEYVWKLLQNNCAHVTHNALAAAGVWDHFPTGKFFLFAALDFPVPKNEFINQLERTNDLPLANLLDIYADPAARQSLMRENWLPMEPGALAEIVHVRKSNDIYDTDLKLLFYDYPILEIYHRRLHDIEAEPRYFDIRANLAYFAKLYQTILAARKPIAWYVKDAAAHHVNRTPQLLASPLERRDFAAFHDRFYRYVSGQQEAVQATLAALPRRGIASNPPATP